MERKAVRVALIPKFRSFVGNLDFEGDPIAVAGFDKAEFAYWRGPVAASGTFLLKIEGSIDGTVWTGLHTADPGVDTEGVYTLDPLTYPLLRSVISLSGTTSVAVTCWLLVTLVRRRNASNPVPRQPVSGEAPRHAAPRSRSAR